MGQPQEHELQTHARVREHNVKHVLDNGWMGAGSTSVRVHVWVTSAVEIIYMDAMRW